MAGVGGSAGFEQEKGRSACVFIRLRSLLKLEHGITIFYRLGRGFLGQKVLQGDQKDRQGRKSYHGGGWGQCSV